MRNKLVVTVLVVGLLLGGLAGVELYRQAQVESRFPAPGRLVDINGRKLQLDCRGSGSPTIVLEAGGDDIFGSAGWAVLQDDIAAMTRVCAYSRAGYMWSDSRNEPLAADDGARDVRAALSLAGEAPPFLPIGYSRGAFNALIFADLFGPELAGLIFLEPRHPDLEQRRQQAGIQQGGDSSLTLAQFARALRWTGLPRMFASYCEKPWYSEEIINSCKAYWPHSLDGIISEGSMILTAQARAADVTTLRDLPVLVLTRQFKDEWLGSDTDARANAENSENLWRELHAEIASLSTNGTQRMVPASTHTLPYTHPQVVLDAVKDLLELIRQQ